MRLQPISEQSKSSSHSNSHANDSPGRETRLLHGFASSNSSLSGAGSSSSSSNSSSPRQKALHPRTLSSAGASRFYRPNRAFRPAS